MTKKTVGVIVTPEEIAFSDIPNKIDPKTGKPAELGKGSCPKFVGGAFIPDEKKPEKKLIKASKVTQGGKPYYGSLSSHPSMQRIRSRKCRRFIEEYLVDMNGRGAAERAGLSPRTGDMYLRQAEVILTIKELLDERSDRTQIRADDVLRDLRLLADQCLGRVPIAKRVDDKEVSDIVWNPAAANKALENLGRHLGMFTDVTRNASHEDALDELQRKMNESRTDESSEVEVVGGVPVLRRDLAKDSDKGRPH